MRDEMKIYKNFARYAPGNGITGVTYLKDEEDNDWYALQKKLAGDTMKIAFDRIGQIIDARTEVTTLVPLNLRVTALEADSLPYGFPDEATFRWEFDSKKVAEKSLMVEEWQAKAEAQRQSLLNTANVIMTRPE